jgi:hypothetical protein
MDALPSMAQSIGIIAIVVGFGLGLGAYMLGYSIGQGFFGVFAFTVVIVAGIYFSKGPSGEYPSFQYANIFAMYLPVTYILVGILSDIVAQQYKTSAASVTAIAAVVLNKMASSFMVNLSGATTQRIEQAMSQSGSSADLYRRVFEGCTVPGLETFESILAPQSLVIIWTLFVYFAIDISANQTGQSVSALWWMTFAALVIQMVAIHANKCLTGEFYYGNNIFIALFIAIVIGSVTGSLGWGFNRWLTGGGGSGGGPAPSCSAGQYSAGGICCPNGQVNDGGICRNNCSVTGETPVAGVCQSLTPNTPHSYSSALPPVGGPTGGSSGGSDDNQFVCEAYKNGELITSTIAE